VDVSLSLNFVIALHLMVFIVIFLSAAKVPESVSI